MHFLHLTRHEREPRNVRSLHNTMTVPGLDAPAQAIPDGVPSELASLLAKEDPTVRIIAQSFMNSAHAIKENAFLLRSLMPGGRPPKLKLNKDDASKRGRKKRKTESLDGDDMVEKPAKKKRAASGYILFSNHMRPNVTGTPPAIMKELGFLWNQCSEEKKAEWNEKAKTTAADADAAGDDDGK